MSLDYLVKNMYDMLYPVGICIDFDSESVDPNVAFPGTTWVRITDGRYSVAGPSGTAGTLGGSASFNLSVANLPAHNHTMSHIHSIAHSHGTITSSSGGAHTHTFSATTSTFDYGTKTTNETGSHTHSIASDVRSYYGDSSHISYKPGTGRSSGAAGNHAHTVVIGSHNHTLSGTTASNDAHSHTVGIPSYSGNSGAASTENTGNVGSGTSISFFPSWHKYARWKRTA